MFRKGEQKEKVDRDPIDQEGGYFYKTTDRDPTSIKITRNRYKRYQYS